MPLRTGRPGTRPGFELELAGLGRAKSASPVRNWAGVFWGSQRPNSSTGIRPVVLFSEQP